MYFIEKWHSRGTRCGTRFLGDREKISTLFHFVTSYIETQVSRQKITASDSQISGAVFFYAYAHFLANLHPVENVMLPRREPTKGFFLKMLFPI